MFIKSIESTQKHA